MLVSHMPVDCRLVAYAHKASEAPVLQADPAMFGDSLKLSLVFNGPVAPCEGQLASKIAPEHDFNDTVPAVRCCALHAALLPLQLWQPHLSEALFCMVSLLLLNSTPGMPPMS